MTYRLFAILSLLSVALPAAAAAPSAEPPGSILRTGRDLEWSQPADTEHPHAEEQRAFQEWMRAAYAAWRDQWREPEGIEWFAAEHRQIRRALTRLHRKAVRTGVWSAPSIDLAARTMEITAQPRQRVSARLLRKNAERIR